MSDIKVKRAHHLSLKEARKVAQKVADDLGEEYDLESRWEGDTVHFRRSGVDGVLQVTASHIDLTVTLGFLLRPFRSTFEHHIERNLDKLLPKGSGTAVAKAGKPAKKATRKT